MNRIRVKTILCVALAAVMVAALVIASLALIPRTRSEEILPNPNVAIDDGNGALSVYVSGAEVEEAKDGGYFVPAGAEVTVTVVNETGIFRSLSVTGAKDNGRDVEIIVTNENDAYDYGCVLEGVIAGPNGLNIFADASGVTDADTGKLFSLPYTVDDGDDLLALTRIFADDYASADPSAPAKADDLGRFGLAAGEESKLQHGYFRMTANIIVNSDQFEGLGSRTVELPNGTKKGMPFQGCFDFNGNYAYINISKTNAKDIDFARVDSAEDEEKSINVADFGFFSYLYGEGVQDGSAAGAHPCLVRGADVRGSIAVNTVASSGLYTGQYRVHAGGVAGSAGKNVVIDGARSQVSVSVQAGKASLVLGGIFGFCSASVDEWSNAVYEGDYGSISGITNGAGADVFVGGLAGILQNAYANGFSNTARATSFVANADAETSGSAYVGGLAGIAYVGPALYKFSETADAKNITIRRFVSEIQDSFVLSSVIDNAGGSKTDIDPDDFSSGSAGAVAGGLVGGVYSTSYTVTISSVRFIDSDSGAPLTVSAQTLDAGSTGAVFAGGMVGYIQTDSANHILYEASDFSTAENTNYTFDANVSVSATQNGAGPAYAGGLFGYNAFDIEQSGSSESGLHFHLTDGEHSFNVLAEQSALSVPGATSTDGKSTTMYDVCAGLYSSRLQEGYSVMDFTLYAENAEVTAQRAAGSAATGDIAAGGFVGKASGGSMSNVSMQFGKNVSVNALGYSYESEYNHIPDTTGQNTGNNVYAGGFIGYLQNCTLNENGAGDITVNFGAGSGAGTARYAVRGVQNAVSGNADYKTEGYVGGVFGMLANSEAQNLNFTGASGGSLIYFTSSHDPNTASAGGLIGATRSGANSSSTASYGSGNINEDYGNYSVTGGTVKNAHVVGRAYHSEQVDDKYDIYVGGAIGVFGSESGNVSATVSNIYVYDTVVEAIGEQNMLTYAGGVFGGIWYSGTLSARNCVVIGSSVTASSVSYRAFAAGVTGILQGTTANLTNSYVIDTSVQAQAPNSTAYVAGFSSRCRGGENLNGNYSNAYLNAGGSTTVVAPVAVLENSTYFGWPSYKYAVNHDKREHYQNNYYVIANVQSMSKVALYDLQGHPVEGYGRRWGVAYESDFAPLYLALTESDYTSASVAANRFLTIYEHLQDTTRIYVEGEPLNGNRFSRDTAGTYYASVCVSLPDKEGNTVDYELCTYPIIVGDGTSVNTFDMGVYDADSYQTEEGAVNEPIGSETADGYATYHAEATAEEDGTPVPERNYTYVLVNSGSDKVQNLLVAPSGTLSDNTLLTCFPSLAAVYDASKVTRGEGETDDAYIGRIIGACQNTVVPSSFNGRVTLAFAGEQGNQTQFTLTPSPTLSARVVVVVEYTVSIGGTEEVFGVIVEYLPNKITGIKVEPADDTPSMGSYEQNGYTYYVYAPGDTVRFEATVEYANPRNSYMVEVEFNGTNVSKNGTVTIPTSGYSSSYQVVCTLLYEYKGLLGQNVPDSVTVYIAVRNDIGVTYSLSGANVTADRKAVEKTAYTFTATPQAGYGLAPTVTINKIAVDNIREGGGTATWKDQDIIYTYDSNTGAYAFTLPAEMMTAAVTSLDIHITFAKVYNIVFIANFTGESAPEAFTVTVEAGLQLSEPAGLDDFIKELENSRYGFDFAGFYLASEANSSAAYGSSFEDLKNKMFVNGPIMFYARWTYNVLVETPEGVTVSSGLSSSLVQENGIVPIDDRHGFSFRVRVTAPGGWAGETRFSVYIRNAEDGQYVDITDYFADGANGWSIDADELLELARTNGSGLLYIRVYSDSLTVWQGDSAAQEIDSVRSDGVFTVEYSANYSGAQAPGDVSLLFNVNDGADELDLPADTSLRLYYLQNGAAVWAGSYTVPEGGASSVVLAGKGCVFTALKGFDAFPADRSGISSETFYLVVTLPDNKVNFEAQLGSAASFASSVAVSAAEPDGDLDLEGYGSVAGELAGDSSLQRPTVSAAEKQLQYYRADVRSVTAVNAAAGSYALTYTVTAGCPGIAHAADAPEDVRHANLRYVWEIRRADGGAIGTVWLNGADDTRKNALLQSVSAVYFAAAEGTETLVLDGTDYVVSLLAVRNTQYPGAGTVLWTKTLSA